MLKEWLRPDNVCFLLLLFPKNKFDRITQFPGYGKFQRNGKYGIKLCIKLCKNPGYARNIPEYGNIPRFESSTSHPVYPKTIGVRKWLYRK